MIFKNIVHSLEPGETPSYSASHQDPNYVLRYCKTFKNDSVQFLLSFDTFLNLLKFSTVPASIRNVVSVDAVGGVDSPVLFRDVGQLGLV